MPLSLAELRAACETKTKMRCDGYPRAMFVHQVFEAEREVSLGFKKGKGGYFEQADFEDVLGEWGADEPAGAEEDASAPSAAKDEELVVEGRLHEVVRQSLADVIAAVQGLIVMSAGLEGLAGDIRMGAMPAMWQAVSYPSRKGYASYVEDLRRRLAFFQSWQDGGPPATFWLPGFFFVHSL